MDYEDPEEGGAKGIGKVSSYCWLLRCDGHPNWHHGMDKSLSQNEVAKRNLIRSTAPSPPSGRLRK